MTTTITFPVRMTRAEASQYLLQVHGIRRAPGSLANLASKGEGPSFVKAGKLQVLYTTRDLDEWARSVLKSPEREPR